MPTDLPPLASPERLAVWLRRPADDPRLAEALRSASDRFRGHVRHRVSYVEGDVITLDGGGGRALLLPAFPVHAVTSVLVDGDEVEVRWSANGYVTRRDRGVFPDEPGNVTVTYDHGWADDEIPADIAEVVLDQARAMFAIERGLGQYGAGSVSRSVSQTDAVGITEQWSRAVARWSIAGSRC